MKIIKIPLNAGALSKKQGQEKASKAVIEEIKSFYMKEAGILPFLDYEDVEIDNSNIETANKAISKTVSELDIPAILIGGDHSMTYSSFKAFSKKYSNPGLIVFDAHLDCENNFSPPTHEDYLRVLIEEGHVKKENVILIGIRNFHSKELEFAKKNNLKIYDMRELSRDGKREIADAIMSVAKGFDGL